MKTIEQCITKILAVNVLITILIVSLVIFLASCQTVKRCPTYGYKKVYVNGKKSYFDPVYRHAKNR